MSPPAPQLVGAGGGRAPVVIVGAGLVGLTLAIDLLLQGADVVVLEKGHGVAEGSRSICQAKRTLEIWDRLGVGEAVRDRGATWNVGRVFHRDRELYSFDLLPEPGHKMPAFVNLQQSVVEDLLHARFRALGGQVRFGHALHAIDAHPEGVDVIVETATGTYPLSAEWLVSCEGVRSTVRRALGLSFEGRVFQDRFLIVDVRFRDENRPVERRFWFEPTFHDGQTVLMHRLANDEWRIDFQLGWDADPEIEKQPEQVRARLRAMLGHDDLELVWVSVYVFQCRTLESYVHGRVLFAGDSAHQVSPFGARGGNGGVQDADNLGWKLARVADGRAAPALLDSYNSERLFAARENIGHSTRATDFMTPKTAVSRALRDEVLALAARAPFARALVNSGRLSTPAHLSRSALNTPDDGPWAATVAPGSPAVDAPIRRAGRDGHLLEALGGRFVLLLARGLENAPPWLEAGGERIKVLQLGRDLEDSEGLVSARYDLREGSGVLFRPDQHLAARSRLPNLDQYGRAVQRILQGASMAAAA